MKKKIFPIVWSIAAILLGVIIITSSYAWYVNRNVIGGIDASTRDVTFKYTINGGEKVNTKTYKVTKLAFFDILDDSTITSEVNYLPTMACELKFEFENKNDCAVFLEMEYTADVITKSQDSNEEELISSAYCAGIISKTRLTTVEQFTSAITANNKDLKTDVYPKVTTPATTETIAQNGKLTMYVYIFGVQEIDSALNSDFMDEEFTFKLTISAIPEGGYEVVTKPQTTTATAPTSTSGVTI